MVAVRHEGAKIVGDMVASDGEFVGVQFECGDVGVEVAVGCS